MIRKDLVLPAVPNPSGSWKSDGPAPRSGREKGCTGEAPVREVPELRNRVLVAGVGVLVAGLLERELDATLSGRARAEDPPLRFGDRDVVDARLAAAHQAVLIELP